MKAADDETANALAEQIDGLQILTFEKANQKIKDGLYNRISKLETQGYEPMVKANEDGEKVRIFIKGNEKEVQSLVVFAMDKEDCSLINIVGHINSSNIDDVVKSQTKSTNTHYETVYHHSHPCSLYIISLSAERKRAN